MSRIVKQPIAVQADAETGEPLAVDGQRVLQVLEHFREWIGILQGLPEVDIWRVEVPRGISHGKAVGRHLRAAFYKTWSPEMRSAVAPITPTHRCLNVI